MATYLQFLKETGVRCGEACKLKWTDIDCETLTVRITPEKGSNPRILKITPKLLSMLNSQPQKYPTIFLPNQDVLRKSFQRNMKTEYGQNWQGSLSFEKVVKYLPHFKSAIQLPIYVLGIDL